MKRIFVYGARGHGKVVADTLLATDVPGFAGFVDDDEKLQGSLVIGLPVLGNGQWLRQQAAQGEVAVALGLGENRTRHRVAEQCRAWGLEVLTLVHPAATVSRSAQLGWGAVVMAGGVINPDAKLGSGVIVNTGAVVEHDVVVGDYAHLSPQAAMAGAARIGAFSHLGTGAVVLPGVVIGADTVIGAGAVVVRNIPDSVVAMGVPARVQSLNRGASQETDRLHD